MPGCIALDRLLVDQIIQINLLKYDLQQAIKQLHPNLRQRTNFHRREFPGRIMLQIYRNIYSAQGPIRSIKFTWSPYTFSVNHLNHDQALNLLMKRLNSDVDKGGNHLGLEIAIEKIKSLKTSTQFIIERPRAPYPIATLVHEIGTPGIRKMIPLNLPVFIGPGFGGEKVEIGRLAAHDANTRRKQRSDRRTSEFLFKPLFLKFRI